MSNQLAKKEETAVAERKATVAERFVNKVELEFEGSVGHGVEFTDNEKQLASNLFVKIDSALKQHEADRGGKKTPYTWDNVNMQKLATDAVHRVRLGLDALIKNHIHVVPYYNSKLGKYDLNLQVGYKGKAYYRKRMAVETVKDIRYELVHENDHFKVIKKSGRETVEDYEFDIKEPFNRGNIVGGFGYIIYEDETKNRVVIVTEDEFKKVKATAKTNKIWNQWPEKMRLKTLVHRVTDELTMDPKKINPSYSYVEDQEDPFNDTNKEIKLEQPAASERQDVDINMGNDQADEETASSEKQSSTERNRSAEDSTQRNNTVENSTGQQSFSDDDKQALKDQINEMGKEIYGTDWYREYKSYVHNYDEEAENLLDLDVNGLKHIARTLEHKMGVVE